jgi:hypothetical protein
MSKYTLEQYLEDYSSTKHGNPYGEGSGEYEVEVIDNEGSEFFYIWGEGEDEIRKDLLDKLAGDQAIEVKKYMRTGGEVRAFMEDANGSIESIPLAHENQLERIDGYGIYVDVPKKIGNQVLYVQDHVKDFGPDQKQDAIDYLEKMSSIENFRQGGKLESGLLKWFVNLPLGVQAKLLNKQFPTNQSTESFAHELENEFYAMNSGRKKDIYIHWQKNYRPGLSDFERAESYYREGGKVSVYDVPYENIVSLSQGTNYEVGQKPIDSYEFSVTDNRTGEHVNWYDVEDDALREALENYQELVVNHGYDMFKQGGSVKNENMVKVSESDRYIISIPYYGTQDEAEMMSKTILKTNDLPYVGLNSQLKKDGYKTKFIKDIEQDESFRSGGVAGGLMPPMSKAPGLMSERNKAMKRLIMVQKIVIDIMEGLPESVLNQKMTYDEARSLGGELEDVLMASDLSDPEPDTWNILSGMEEFKVGGRVYKKGRAWHRDRLWKSQEEHEQNYKRKKMANKSMKKDYNKDSQEPHEVAHRKKKVSEFLKGK